MGSRKVLVGCVGFGVALIAVAAVGGFLYWRRIASKANKYIPRTVFVTMTRPFDGSHAALGEPIPVAAEAVGAYPVQTLELWVDGALARRTNAQNLGLKQLNGFWNWTPESEGQHTLTVRGLDEHGQSLVSNSVRVLVGAAPPMVMRVMPKTVDTLISLAAQYNLPPEAAAQANPDIDPASPLPAGQPVDLPIPAGGSLPEEFHAPLSLEISPTPLPPPDPPPPPPPPDGDESVPPSAPFLWAEVVDGCKIQVEVKAQSDNAAGFRLYMLGPGANSKTELERDKIIILATGKSTPNYDVIQPLPAGYTLDEVSVDVTDAVKAWSHPQFNNGFVSITAS